MREDTFWEKIWWWMQIHLPDWMFDGWYAYMFSPKSTYYCEISWPKVLLCRLKRHPCGSWYYNPGGDEPDGHCKNCGDEIE
jgi:hypothetical protein